MSTTLGDPNTSEVVTAANGQVAKPFVVKNYAGSELFSVDKDGNVSITVVLSASLAGTPTAPTAAEGTNNTQIATTAFVERAVTSLRITQASYVIYLDGSTYKARNGSTGAIDYSGASAAAVIAAAIVAAGTNGSIYCKGSIDLAATVTIDPTVSANLVLIFEQFNITGDHDGIVISAGTFNGKVTGQSLVFPANYTHAAISLDGCNNAEIDVSKISSVSGTGSTGSTGVSLLSSLAGGCHSNDVHVGLITGIETGIYMMSSSVGWVNVNRVQVELMLSIVNGVYLYNGGVAVSSNTFLNVNLEAASGIGFRLDSVGNTFINCATIDMTTGVDVHSATGADGLFVGGQLIHGVFTGNGFLNLLGTKMHYLGSGTIEHVADVLPVLHLPFQVTQSSRVPDISPYKNEGLSVDVTTTTGRSGTAVVLNGTSATITIPSSPSLCPTTDMSIVMWFKAVAGNIPVINKEGSYYLYWDGSANIDAAIAPNDFVYSASLVPDDDWHMIAVTHTKDGSDILYLDGVAVSATATADSDITVNTNSVQLGYIFSDYRAGTINDVKIYDQALSAADIGRLKANNHITQDILDRSRAALGTNHGTSTGTGAQQTIVHGLEHTPRMVILSEATTGGAYPYQSAAADATNIYITATNEKTYAWRAEI